MRKRMFMQLLSNTTRKHADFNVETLQGVSSLSKNLSDRILSVASFQDAAALRPCREENQAETLEKRLCVVLYTIQKRVSLPSRGQVRGF